MSYVWTFLVLANKFSVRVSKFFWRIKTLWALLDVLDMQKHIFCSNHSWHSLWEMVRFSILQDSQFSIWRWCKNSSSLENVHLGLQHSQFLKTQKGKLHALPDTELLIIKLSILLVIFEKMWKLSSIGCRWKEMGNLMGSLHILCLHIPLFHVDCNDRNQFFYQCSWSEAGIFLLFA